MGPQWDPFLMLKSYWVVVVAYRILVSAQGPLVLGFWVFEFLNNSVDIESTVDKS